MSYRYRPTNAQTDPDDPQTWGTCDRCGFVYNLDNLLWQYDYQGAAQLQNLRILVCQRCYDAPQPQLSPVILSPDPPPVFNARPNTYEIPSASWMGTEDDVPITAEDGEPFSVPVPEPEQSADTTRLYCTISAPGADLSTLYLDVFDGNPSAGGRSVLSAITGSSTRTDIAGDLTTSYLGYANNFSAIIVSAASESQTNINWVGLYSASISGSLLMSGPCSVSQTIAAGNPVRFSSLGLRINI